MNGNDHDEDPVMDWALGERLGGETAPDLLAAVRQRLDAKVPLRAPAPRTGSPLWAAAALMLGTVVVIGVATWPREQTSAGPAAPQGPQEPKLEPVHSLRDAEALSATTRGVEAVNVGDDVIAALAKLRDLEVLVVRVSPNESFGMSLKMAAPANLQHVTTDLWRHVTHFTKLRRLELSGTSFAGRLQNLDSSSSGLAVAMSALPLLESLTLRFLDTNDQALAMLPHLRGLRRLDLSFNHGFVEQGIEHILKCRSLRSLSLDGCQQLHGGLLARLHELPELEELNLAHIDGMNWRAGTAEADDDIARAVRQLAQRHADKLGMGPSDEALAGLAKSPKLRVLNISGGHWSGTGLAELGACATLVELNAFGGQFGGHAFVASLPPGLQRLEVCGDYTDGFCTAVAESLPKLRHLTIAACYEITDRGLAAVSAMPSLRVLDMRQMRGLTVASVDTLLAARQLEELDVRHCDFVTADHVVRLRRSLPNLKKLETSVADADIAAAEQPPVPFRISNKAQLELLPIDARAIAGTGLDGDCLAALTRFPSLESLSLHRKRPPALFYPEVPLFDDGGLQPLAKLTTLRSLHVDRLPEAAGKGLAVIAQLPLLTDLRVSKMTVSDVTLAKLEGMRIERLTLDGCWGFGRAGMDSIARLRTLRELSLSGCRHLEDTWIERLTVLPRLDRLDLSLRCNQTDFTTIFEQVEVNPGSGVTAPVLAALGTMPTLRELSLAFEPIDADGLRNLGTLATLQSLDLTGTQLLAADLEALPPSLTRLVLTSCPRLGQDFGPALSKGAPHLHTLVLSSSNDLQDACLLSLQAVRSLRVLDLSYCRQFTADAADHLVAMPWLESLTLHNWPVFESKHWAKIRAMPNLKVLETEKMREVLR